MSTSKVFGWVVVSGLAALVSACGAASPSEPSDGVGEVGAALKSGCHWDCPKCPPNKICPLGMCVEVCPGKTCTQTALCIQGYTWSAKRCACVADPAAPAASSCATDADCRTFADYCTGCDCRALSYSDADPFCSGPGVRCFADPCMGRAAVCINGSCSLQ